MKGYASMANLLQAVQIVQAASGKVTLKGMVRMHRVLAKEVAMHLSQSKRFEERKS